MGNCCIKYKPQKKIVLLLVGLDNAGKTVTVKGLAGESRESVVPTIGFSVFNLHHQNCNISIYDLGGGSQIRGIWPRYFSDVHGIIFVVDACDYSRLDEAKQVLEDLLSSEKLIGKPLLVLANKQDCPGALDELDIIEKLKIEILVNLKRCPTLVKACTALDNTNKKLRIDSEIEKGFIWLLNYINKEYWIINTRVERDVKEQKQKELASRRRVVEQIHQETIRSKENAIEWDIESTHTVFEDPFKPLDEILNINSTSPIKENHFHNNDSLLYASSDDSSCLPPQILFEKVQVHSYNSNNSETVSQESKDNENNGLQAVQKPNVHKRPFSVFAKMSNKTSPATLVTVNSLRTTPKMREKIVTKSVRRHKSADLTKHQILSVHQLNNSDINRNDDDIFNLRKLPPINQPNSNGNNQIFVISNKTEQSTSSKININ